MASPIVGVTNPGDLTAALGALGIWLTSDEIAELERHYRPHAVVEYH